MFSKIVINHKEYFVINSFPQFGDKMWKTSLKKIKIVHNKRLSNDSLLLWRKVKLQKVKSVGI